LPRGGAGFGRFAQEDLMRKLTLRTTVWIAAALVLTASVIAAGAQIQTRGEAGLHAQMQNATPIEQAAVGDGVPIVRRERSAAAARFAAGAFVADSAQRLSVLKRRNAKAKRF
jgi:hypothetical protein